MDSDTKGEKFPVGSELPVATQETFMHMEIHIKNTNPPGTAGDLTVTILQAETNKPVRYIKKSLYLNEWAKTNRGVTDTFVYPIPAGHKPAITHNSGTIAVMAWSY